MIGSENFRNTLEETFRVIGGLGKTERLTKVLPSTMINTMNYETAAIQTRGREIRK